MTKPAILVVEEDKPQRETLCEILELAGYHTFATSTGVSTLAMMEERAFDMVVASVRTEGVDGQSLQRNISSRYPEVPVLMMTAYDSTDKAVSALRDGAVNYLVKPFAGNALLSLVRKHVTYRIRKANSATRGHRSGVLQLADRAANSGATVLISGEAGSGRGILARYIHEHSPRRDGPFVVVNCAAISRHMLEATLFGCEKGAFVGAERAVAGKFEQADGGTLLLDEITEMDSSCQARLLEVLQQRQVRRLGSASKTAVDVRVLATSNINISHMIREGMFREELYFRLNVFPLRVPRLFEQGDEIIAFAKALLEMHQPQQGAQLRLGEEAKLKLSGYHWPGNIRELDAVIRRGIILARTPEISAGDIHLEVVPDRQENADEQHQHEYRRILQVLEHNHGNRRQCAEDLGISERSLSCKMASLREAGYELP